MELQPVTVEQVKAAVLAIEPDAATDDKVAERVVRYCSTAPHLARTDKALHDLYCWTKGLLELGV